MIDICWAIDQVQNGLLPVDAILADGISEAALVVWVFVPWWFFYSRLDDPPMRQVITFQHAVFSLANV